MICKRGLVGSFGLSIVSLSIGLSSGCTEQREKSATVQVATEERTLAGYEPEPAKQSGDLYDSSRPIAP